MIALRKWAAHPLALDIVRTITVFCIIFGGLTLAVMGIFIGADSLAAWTIFALGITWACFHLR